MKFNEIEKELINTLTFDDILDPDLTKTIIISKALDYPDPGRTKKWKDQCLI